MSDCGNTNNLYISPKTLLMFTKCYLCNFDIAFTLQKLSYTARVSNNFIWSVSILDLYIEKLFFRINL